MEHRNERMVVFPHTNSVIKKLQKNIKSELSNFTKHRERGWRCSVSLESFVTKISLNGKIVQQYASVHQSQIMVVEAILFT